MFLLIRAGKDNRDRYVHVHLGQALEPEAPDLLASLPARVWKQRWGVHCQPAGSGQAARQYLSRYVFKTATGHRALPLLPHGRVRRRYPKSTTGQQQHLDWKPFELIRRFLQHVLPAGFHRLRRFGWLHPAARLKLNRVRTLLKQPAVLSDAQRAAWQPPQPQFEPPQPLPPPDRTPVCPHCRRPMTHCGWWGKGQGPLPPPVRGPP